MKATSGEEPVGAEAKARTMGRGRSFIGQGPMPQVGRACGPLGGAARRSECCARGEGGKATAGWACGRSKGVGVENFSGVSSGKARCHGERFRTGASSLWHRGFPDESDEWGGAGVWGGSGENEDSSAVSHRARPDATGGRACGRSKGVGVKNSGRGFIGQGSMTRGEIHGRIKFFVASGLPR